MVVSTGNVKPCSHPRPAYYRVPFQSGSGYHVAELCSDCGKNLRGAGVWVSRHKVHGDPNELPLSPWHRRAAASSETSLFAGVGGE